MDKYLGLLSFVLLLDVILRMPLFLSDYRSDVQSVNDYALQVQVNHASDSAVAALLDSSDLEQDYNEEAIIVDPDLGLREFATVLGKELGYSISDTTLKEIEEKYIKAFLICSWDGVYAYTLRDTETRGRDFVSTPKIPYYYTKNPGTDAQVQYVLNLGLKKGYHDGFRNGTYHMFSYDSLNLTKDEQLQAINQEVSEILQATLDQAYTGDTKARYALPAFASQISGGQPVDKITVIGVVDPEEALTSVSLGVGGSYIDLNDPIVGFISDGVKYYARQSRLQNSAYANCTVTQQFDTEFDAADNGYHCKLDLFE